MTKEKKEEFYWDWLKHENNIFTSRGNFFLIAESALLAIIATKSTTSLIYPTWICLLIPYLCKLIKVKN